MSWTKVATLDELWSGEMIGLEVDGVRVLVLRMGDEVRAFEDRCAHLGVPLSEGCFDGREITCRAHEWRYDASSGAGINPRSAVLTALKVDVRGGEILVEIA